MSDSTARQRDDEADAPLSLLVVGDASVQSFTLPRRGAVVLGRAHDCDVSIADESVSRRHARLEVSPLRLEDLGSANGTRVGNERVPRGAPVALAAGDAFRVGAVTIFVQRGRANGSAYAVRTDGYFEGRLAAECARAERFGLRFAIVTIAAGTGRDLEAAARAEMRPSDVLAMSGAQEARLVLVHMTRKDADALADAVCARVEGDHDVGLATYPEDGLDPGRLLAAARTRSRRRGGGARRDVELVAEDPAMLAVLERARRLAAHDVHVLVTGEPGVGKTLLAEWMHALSPRGRRPLVRVACDALAEDDLATALFGVSDAERDGAVEEAQDGTLLLCHVDALSPALAARLAHLLEHAQTFRVGSTTPHRVRVRVLATTRRPAERDATNPFAGTVLQIPPLRARLADIEPLAHGFAASARTLATAGRPAPRFDDAALAALRADPWAGNVRALRIAIDRAVASADGEVLGLAALDLPVAAAVPLGAAVEVVERERIAAALVAHGGNKSRAARALGIARNTLLARLRAYGLTGSGED